MRVGCISLYLFSATFVKLSTFLLINTYTSHRVVFICSPCLVTMGEGGGVEVGTGVRAHLLERNHVAGKDCVDGK